MDNMLRKGDRVRAQWFQATETCLAGVQPKMGATLVVVTGTITHIRGDHPTTPTTIRLWVQPDDGTTEVVVDPKHIVAINPS